MAAFSESALDINDKGSSSPLTGLELDCMPTELLFYIFKKLDIQALRICFDVSRKWREIAKTLCELQDLWHALAEDGMVNYGVEHHFKSTLGWRDLYFNSLLWNNIQSATFVKINETRTLRVQNMHVYRDKLIVVDPNGVGYYDIETFREISFYGIENCEDYQETDEIFMIVTEDIRHCLVTVFIKDDKDERIYIGKYFNKKYMRKNDNKQFTFVSSWRWRMVGNCVYVIDSKSVLWKCYSCQGSLAVNALSRFYGDFQLSSDNSLLNSLHVSKDNVFVALTRSDLLMVSEGNMMFHKVKNSDIPTTLIESLDAHKRPPAKENADKFDAFVTIPFGIRFPEGVSPKNMLHFHYEDPSMTAGLQHGDVVLRGFEDGRILITILRSNSELELNLKQFDKDLEETAVLALDVCELKGMHKLFVGTETKLYVILLTYPHYLLEH